ncbi:MAG TPA: tyrosine/phenylalanine carboxypeptidase domain-containing protein [Polyangiaceae bacterium]
MIAERPPASGLLRAVARLVLHASRAVQMLGALTPQDAHRERTRLVGALSAGRPAVPRWTYAPWDGDDVRRALDAAERAIAREAAPGLEALMLERVRELSLEASLCAAAGTTMIGRLARERFAPPRAHEATEASALCARWLAEPACIAPAETVASDGDDPASLLSLMRAAVGRLRLPFSVIAQPTLASLAATGDGVIFVAVGRAVGREDAARTVLHEIEGHAVPRSRAMGARLTIVRAGTARGVDDQEGLALLLEERAGWLGARRRRQLAARHRAFEAMGAGGSFSDVAETLVRDHGLDAPHAVAVAERVFRGSDGKRPGLGRERVYLEAYVRVGAHLAKHPTDEEVMAAGQIAVHAAPVLRPFTEGSTRTGT